MTALRPPRPAEAEAVAALIVAGDVADVGVPDYSLGDLQDQWAASGFELARDAVVAEDGGAIVGYAAVHRRHALAVVHPERMGEGIGTALLDWCESRGPHAQGVGERNAAARALLESRGYAQVRHYWRMDIELGDAAEPEPPPGVTLRPLRLPDDGDAVYAISEAAFSSAPDYRGETRAQFGDEHLGAHDLDPALSRVAERDRGLAGFALVRRWDDGVAYVDLLAVHPDAAGHGIGGTLLRAAFAAASRAGFARVQLGVASDNPNATRLYERVGMTRRFRVDAYEPPGMPD
jgi:mycothiol synthase